MAALPQAVSSVQLDAGKVEVISKAIIRLADSGAVHPLLLNTLISASGSSKALHLDPLIPDLGAGEASDASMTG